MRVSVNSSILPHLRKYKRFDILIKLHYARLKKKCGKKWRDFTYSKHVRHITGPSEKVVEHDGTKKVKANFLKYLIN